MKSDTGMKINEYKNIYDNEQDHFFYVSTHELAISLMNKFARTKKKKLKILDAGCGTGLLTKKLEIFGSVTGVDVSPEALRFAKKRKVKAVKASIDNLPFKKESFDVVVSIDAIASKSIKNDMVVLREIHRVLKPEGIFILRASANDWLNLIHDKHVHLGHRYSKKELQHKLIGSGFIVKKLSYIHSILFPLIILRHFWENIRKPKVKSTIGKVNPIINRLVTWLLIIETKLFHIINLPFGVGLVSVSKKP